jgi:starvation-inducible DNA-binding protein
MSKEKQINLAPNAGIYWSRREVGGARKLTAGEKKMRISDTPSLRAGVLEASTDLDRNTVEQISNALRELHADAFALYMKTKNVHWHMTEQRQSRDIARPQHLQDNDEELVRTTDMLAELCLGFQALTRSVRAEPEICEQHRDFAAAS